VPQKRSQALCQPELFSDDTRAGRLAIRLAQKLSTNMRQPAIKMTLHNVQSALRGISIPIACAVPRQN